MSALLKKLILLAMAFLNLTNLNLVQAQTPPPSPLSSQKPFCWAPSQLLRPAKPHNNLEWGGFCYPVANGVTSLATATFDSAPLIEAMRDTINFLRQSKKNTINFNRSDRNKNTVIYTVAAEQSISEPKFTAPSCKDKCSVKDIKNFLSIHGFTKDSYRNSKHFKTAKPSSIKTPSSSSQVSGTLLGDSTYGLIYYAVCETCSSEFSCQTTDNPNGCEPPYACDVPLIASAGSYYCWCDGSSHVVDLPASFANNGYNYGCQPTDPSSHDDFCMYVGSCEDPFLCDDWSCECQYESCWDNDSQSCIPKEFC